MRFWFIKSKAFKQEIQSWLDEQIIDQPTAKRLYEKYQLEGDSPWYARSGFILSAVAVLFVAMGLLLLISENWHELGTPLRMSVGLVPLGVAYLWGFYELQRSEDSRAELAFFLANLLFGINIFLQAQIWHIDTYFPNAFLWLAIGTVPVILYFRSTASLLVLTLALMLYLGFQLANYNFSLLGLLPMGAMLYMVWQKPTRATLLLAVINIFLFVFNIAENLERGREHLELFSLFAVICFLLMLFLQRLQFVENFVNAVSTILLLALFGWVFALTWQNPVEGISAHKVTYSAMVLAAMGLAVFAAWLTELSFEVRAAAGVVAYVLVVHLVSQFISPGANEMSEDNADIVTVFTNLSFFGLAGLFVARGIKHRYKKAFMLGIILLLALAIGRYIDYFANYVTMALVFMAAGAFTWFINRYWNKKYELHTD